AAARSDLDFGIICDRSPETERLRSHSCDRRAASGSMTKSKRSIEDRVEQLHAGSIIDMHFDLPMDLYEKRAQPNVLANEFLAEFETGGMGIIGAAIYIEDRYLPERGLQVALDQIARLYTEAEQSKRCVICRTHDEISRALNSKQTGFLITMEGVEPLGDDLDLLRAFYELGVRAIGLTHARDRKSVV